MKNAGLILLTIVSIALLNSCGGTSTEPNSVTTSSPVASSPSTQPNDKSKGTIDPKLLKEYQESQKKLVVLLDKRVVKDSKQKVAQEIRDSLNKELTNFNAALEKIDKTANKDIQDKTKSFRQIIYFKDLSGATPDLKDLQGRLMIQAKDIGAEEGKFFGKKTSVALSEEIVKFGQELETYAKTTTQTPRPTASEKPKPDPTDSNWLGTLAAVLSVLSAIGSGIAIYIAKNSTKKPTTNSQQPARSNNQLSSNLSGNRGSFDRVDDRSFNEVDRLRSEINALRSDLQETKFNYTNLSERFNKLSQQQTNNAASNYREDTRFNDDYGKDLNRDQRASTRDRYSVSTPPSPPPQPAWIDEYNQNSRSFYTKYAKAEVLEEEQNIEGRRSGRVLTVNLSIVPQRTGGYWVFDQDNQLMLVPSSEVRINQFNRDTFDDMFDYSEFRSGYRKIVLSQPAIVEPNPAGGYQLVRRGRIEFE
ncbi:hypothetical protein [Chamaesiphon sp. OTE_75_metabat_556]|uniref:hypothetical protein n=1 Tax=Chamaesiphon sp. OTE_75_metabat_556 TaxID=2964692 RepID=UPI00286D3554|nr:hypothetical protein [Chamaesiphon sp. OTE_75_metabat_556]